MKVRVVVSVAVVLTLVVAFAFEQSRDKNQKEKLNQNHLEQIQQTGSVGAESSLNNTSYIAESPASKTHSSSRHDLFLDVIDQSPRNIKLAQIHGLLVGARNRLADSSEWDSISDVDLTLWTQSLIDYLLIETHDPNNETIAGDHMESTIDDFKIALVSVDQLPDSIPAAFVHDLDYVSTHLANSDKNLSRDLKLTLIHKISLLATNAQKHTNNFVRSSLKPFYQDRAISLSKKVDMAMHFLDRQDKELVAYSKQYFEYELTQNSEVEKQKVIAATIEQLSKD